MSLRVFANRRGDRARISALTLAGATLAVLRGGGAPSIGWANRLGDAVAARTTEPGDVLLVPQDVRRQVRNLLAERVPGLPVIGPGEYPDGVKFLQRGRPLRIEERMRIMIAPPRLPFLAAQGWEFRWQVTALEPVEAAPTCRERRSAARRGAISWSAELRGPAAPPRRRRRPSWCKLRLRCRT